MNRDQMINDLILRGWEPVMSWRFPAVMNETTIAHTTGPIPFKSNAHPVRHVRWDAISTYDLEKIHEGVVSMENYP